MPETTSGLRVETRPAVPFSRVQEIVRDLLGVTDLNGLRGLTVHRHAVEVEIYATAADGSHFLRGDDIAVDRIHFPIDMES